MPRAPGNKRSKEKKAEANRERNPETTKKNNKKNNSANNKKWNKINNKKWNPINAPINNPIQSAKRHDARVKEQLALLEVSDMKYVFVNVRAYRSNMK